MAYVARVHKSATGVATGVGPTAAIDTTVNSVNLIVIVLSWFSGVTTGVTPTDSKNNTWTPLTRKASLAGTVSTQVFYCYGPTTDANHTFSMAGTQVYPSIYAAAFSGSTTSPADQESAGGTVTAGTTVSTGSATPSQNNELLIAAVVTDGGSGITVDNATSGFTVLDTQDPTGSAEGGALAYLIQTTAAAKNPVYTWTTNANAAAIQETFKDPTSGGSAPKFRARIVVDHRNSNRSIIVA